MPPPGRRECVKGWKLTDTVNLSDTMNETKHAARTQPEDTESTEETDLCLGQPSPRVVQCQVDAYPSKKNP